ncbi:MAG TPA: alpha/beta fold hydrolase [Pyrinomonadaceae bacterium]|nr:alpha/beta fold hydrolase [Pyrinomonadaceae bacterium]
MSNNQKLPIVLAHGIARFDILLEMLREKLDVPDAGDEFQYFKGIKAVLEDDGFTVFHPNQDFAGPVDSRAEQLKARVNEALSMTGADKVHIIGHSMGGLDARHMIVDKGMSEKVASLTTIGTPHLGTILADHLLGPGGKLLMHLVKPVLNIDGFTDLTITACEQFNARAEDQEARNKVVYQTYASFEALNLVFALLVPSWLFIQHHIDPNDRNDGLVPVSSQKWKKELVASDGTPKPVGQNDFPFPADHLNEVGWWDLQEAVLGSGSLSKQAEDYEKKIKDLYLGIARGLQ